MLKSDHQTSPPALIGFGRADLASALSADKPIAKERVEVRALYAAPAASPAEGSVWVVLDFMDFDLEMVNFIRTGIVSATHLHPEQIHILTTHNHGVGDILSLHCDTPDFAKIGAGASGAAAQAIAGARPAQMRAVQIQMPPGCNYRRRIHVPEFDGMWTCFGGPDMAEKRSASGFIENAIESLREGRLEYVGWRESDRPAPQFEPADPDFFLMEFRNAETGAILGTLSRFAMHATMRSRAEEYYSGDFPWHIRHELEKRRGGIAVFMNGPCADIAPCFPFPDKTTGLAPRYAREMADKALTELDKTAFEPLTAVRQAWKVVPLPVRREVLDSHVDISDPIPDFSDLPARKRWYERERLSTTLYFLEYKYRNGETAPSAHIHICLGMLTLNEWMLLAFPGETFWLTGRAVQAAFPDKKLVTATEHDRTVMYMPPEEEYRSGGYESICTVTEPPAEALLRAAAIQFVREESTR